jgi:hypothetical protein
MFTTRRSVRLLTTVAVAALTACADNVGPDVVDHSQEIDQVVTSVDKFAEAATFSKVEKVKCDTTAESKLKPDGSGLETTYFSCVTERHSVSENPQDFMMYDPLSSVLWPGNLVQGKSIASGVPTTIPISERAPANITLAIVSGGTGAAPRTRRIDDFRFSTVNQAMNEILSDYTGGTPAKYAFSMQRVYSASQLEFGLDVGYTGPSFEMTGKLNINWQEQKSRLVVKLTQKFFTMVFDDPEGPSGVFRTGFDPGRLDPYTGAGNPITYISSVTYGRIYYLLFESSASHLELETALNLAYNGGVTTADLDAKAKWDKVMSETKVSAWQIGGDPEAGLNAAKPESFENFDAVKQFITKGANFSPTNIGEPISYTIKYLKDASLVRMNNTMEYTVRQCTPYATTTQIPRSIARFTIDKIEVISSNSPKLFPGDAGIGVAIFIVNKKTGVSERKWLAPSNQTDRTWYKLVSSGFYGEQNWSLGWNVPEIQLDKTVDWGMRLELWGMEWYPTAGFSMKNENVIIDFDPSRNAWVQSGGLTVTSAAMTQEVQIPGGWNTKLKFTYRLTMNDIYP